MGSVPAVAMYPGRESITALVRVVVSASIRPLAQGALDEPLGLAVGSGRVRLRVVMAQAELGACVGEVAATVGLGVVGVDTLDADVERGVVGDGGPQESNRA